MAAVSKRKNWGGHFLLLLSLVTVVGAGLLAWGCYELLRSEFPDVSILKKQYPVVHYSPRDPRKPDADRVSIEFSKTRPASWTSLADVAKPAVGAIVVSEDWAFFQHKGYDAKQIREAIKEDWEEGRFARGASTITQQVAKNVFLEADKNLWRKLKEFYLALRLEEKVG
jgi:monofunctional biosynthetic peptidoglycan transglycosylase